jgi:hypothetical protein
VKTKLSLRQHRFKKKKKKKEITDDNTNNLFVVGSEISTP